MVFMSVGNKNSFDTVFFVGFEDGLIPSKQNFEDDSKVEEECRLAYVGVTRAMKNLECSYVDSRMRFGQILYMQKSRFLASVDPKLFRFVDEGAQFTGFPTAKSPPRFSEDFDQDRERFKPKAPYRPQRFRDKVEMTSAKPQAPIVPEHNEFSQEEVQLRVGQMVLHAKFGEGRVMSVSGFGPDMMLTIMFKEEGRKQMLARFAKLTVL